MDKTAIIIKCKICEKELSIDDSRNIAIKKGDEYYCLPCHEIVDFCDLLTSESKKVTVIKKEEPKIKQTNSIKCIKCNIDYNGTNCPKCNEPNILYVRKKKKKKKK